MDNKSDIISQHEFTEILELAKENEGLADLLSQLKTYYILTRPSPPIIDRGNYYTPYIPLLKSSSIIYTSLD